MLADEWRSFREQVIPKNASSVQIQEMRRAFYCGAKGFLRLLEDSPDDDQANENYLLALKAELKEFRDRVTSGRD